MGFIKCMDANHLSIVKVGLKVAGWGPVPLPVGYGIVETEHKM